MGQKLRNHLKKSKPFYRIKWVYFQNVLLKMFTFVRHYMHFILSKVLSTFRLSYKIIAHSVCTD